MSVQWAVLRYNTLVSTYSSDFLKVAAVASEVDELLIEEPGEAGLQGGVMGHLAGQDDALPHRHVQRRRLGGDHRGLCDTKEKQTHEWNLQ